MNIFNEKLKEAISYISLFFKAENEYTPELMRENPYKIQELINPAKDLQIAAIQTDPSVIQFIPKVSEKMQLLAITVNPASIQYIPNPTKDAQLTAVKISPSVIQHIKEPSKDIMLTAIQRDSSVIKYISNPSEDLQFVATRNNPEAIQYIKHPTTEVQLEVIYTSQNTKLTEKVEMDMVKANPKVISLFNNPSEAIQLAAVKEDPFVISKISNPSEAVQLAAIQNDIYSLQFINSPTKEVQLAAIKRSSNNPFYINALSEQIKLVAIQNNPNLINLIKNPSELLQVTAVQTNPNVFSLIVNPSPATHKAIIERMCNIKIHSNVDNNFIAKAQSLLTQLNAIEQRHGALWLQADYSDDRQQARQEKHEADIWKDAETNKTITSFKEDIKDSYPFIEEKTEDIITSPKEVDTDNKELSLENTNNADFNFQQSSPPSNIKISVENQLLGSKLSEEYRKLGYESVAESIDCSVKTLAANSGVTVCTDEQYQIIKSGSKTLYGDITVENKNGILNVSINNLNIFDKSTGKTEPLNIGDIDLNKQSPETIKELLSGKQVKMTAKSGTSQTVGLSKTPVGWGLQIGRQIFSTTDAGAEV